MKAAVLYELNGKMKVENGIEIPVLWRGQVLVKLAWSGVCHSQLMEVCGNRGEDKYLPHLLGHEGSGEVIETGPDVLKVKPGDKIILSWIKGKGIDAGGVKYKKGDTLINAGGVTTFNEYAVVSENRCYQLPEGLPMDVAVLFGCALPTGAGIILNELSPEDNSTIAIFGLGGIGMSALIATNIYNFKKVIVIDINKEKLNLAEELGATDCINASSQNVLKEINRITKGMGVDYSVDAAGLVSTIESAFAAIRKNGGLCIFASHPKTGDKISIDPHELISGKQIRGTWGGACDLDRDITVFADWYKQGKLPIDKLLSKEYSLDNINEAFEDLKNKKIVRALVKI